MVCVRLCVWISVCSCVCECVCVWLINKFKLHADYEIELNIHTNDTYIQNVGLSTTIRAYTLTHAHIYIHTHTHSKIHTHTQTFTRRHTHAYRNTQACSIVPLRSNTRGPKGPRKGSSSSANLILTLAERLLFPLYQNIVERIVADGLRQALDPFLLILLRCGGHAINRMLALHHLNEN